MIILPAWVHRTPQLFYFLAALFAMWSFLIGVFDISAVGTADATDAYVRVAYLRALYSALLEAAYLFSSGVMLHILLAIWDRLAVGRKPEAAE